MLIELMDTESWYWLCHVKKMKIQHFQWGTSAENYVIDFQDSTKMTSLMAQCATEKNVQRSTAAKCVAQSKRDPCVH